MYCMLVATAISFVAHLLDGLQVGQRPFALFFLPFWYAGAAVSSPTHDCMVVANAISCVARPLDRQQAGVGGGGFSPSIVFS